jgi:catechol 2,3-dioxygenase-like lactoylglutathione lyase family enzyme
MGLEGVDADCHWMVGRDELVQLELFAFRCPQPVARAAEARASDVGYARLGLWVADFDAVLARLAERGVSLIHEPLGERGDRRACVRDPDGIFVELFERDPHPAAEVLRTACPVALRSVTVSVHDLEQARAFFGQALGMQETEPLHAPPMEVLWGLEVPPREAVVLDGGPVRVELVAYESARPRPAGYRASDIGILNIALGFVARKTARRVYRSVIEAGFSSYGKPLDAGWYRVVYCRDVQGFSVELLYVHRWLTRFSGYAPR